MGLRCLIGHDYGDPQTSRDRRQRGSEVVVTVREYRECTRCGHRRVLSENKEVTTGAPAGNEPPADARTTEAPAGDEPTAEAAWSSDVEPADPDQATAESFSRSASGAPGDEPMTAAEDDGIILEDEPERPPRAHGEWPEADLDDKPAGDATDEPGPWPDEAGEPGAEEPEPPEPPEPPGPDEEPLDVGPEPTGESAAETSAEPSPEQSDASVGDADPSPPPRPDNRTTEFVCPDCGETWPTRNASLRPGDICPACKRGYLDERVVQ